MNGWVNKSLHFQCIFSLMSSIFYIEIIFLRAWPSSVVYYCHWDKMQNPHLCIQEPPHVSSDYLLCLPVFPYKYPLHSNQTDQQVIPWRRGIICNNSKKKPFYLLSIYYMLGIVEHILCILSYWIITITLWISLLLPLFERGENQSSEKKSHLPKVT